MSQFKYDSSIFNRWTQIYGLVCLLEIIAEIFLEYQVDFGYQLRLLMKPIAMPVLALALYKSLVPNVQQVHWSLLAGLIFSWAGDVLLMPPFRNFILGLVAFLIAHLFYIQAFSKNISLKYWRPLYLLPGIRLFFVVAYTVVPYTGKLMIPVIIYTAVICTMLTTAVVRHFTFSFPVAALGASLFVASDFILAWALFVESFAWNRIFTMSFYLLAQWLIVRGVLTSQKGY